MEVVLPIIIGLMTKSSLSDIVGEGCMVALSISVIVPWSHDKLSHGDIVMSLGCYVIKLICQSSGDISQECLLRETDEITATGLLPGVRPPYRTASERLGKSL